VTTAKLLAGMAIDLLGDGAQRAREVVARAKPAMTRAEYLAFQRSITRTEVYDGGS